MNHVAKAPKRQINHEATFILVKHPVNIIIRAAFVPQFFIRAANTFCTTFTRTLAGPPETIIHPCSVAPPPTVYVHFPNHHSYFSASQRRAVKQKRRAARSAICYAYMQATGMVNDHTTDCFRREALA